MISLVNIFREFFRSPKKIDSDHQILIRSILRLLLIIVPGLIVFDLFLLVVFLFPGLSFPLNAFITNPMQVLVLSIGMTVVHSRCLWLIKNDEIDKGLQLFVGVSAVSIFLFSFVSRKGYYDVGIDFYYPMIIFSSLFLNRKWLFYVGTLALLTISLGFILNVTGAAVIDVLTPTYSDLIFKLFAVAISTYLLRLSISQFSERNSQLNAYAKSLESYQNHLEDLVRQRTEELLVEKDNAEQASHAKSSFMANMSHELRTPLNAIIGYSEMLEEELSEISDGVEFVDDLERVQKAGRHLLELINQVLDISKIESNEFQIHNTAFEIDDLLDDVISIMSPIILNSGNQFNYNKLEEETIIISDQGRLKQILVNLLSNAAKFTHDGVILLNVGLDQLNGDEWVNFSIIDTGIGIDPEFLPNLFEPFKQADNQYNRKFEGTGLGLAISNHLTNLMNGIITVESEPGHGTQFTVSFPLDSEKIERKWDYHMALQEFEEIK